MTPTLALLLKAPRPGSVKTRLAAEVGAARATEIYRQLAERQLRACPAGWRTVVHFDPPDAEPEMRAWLAPRRAPGPSWEFRPQPAGDLGVRINAAFAEGFAVGAPGVIAVGGDCPALDETRLGEAAVALLHADAVIGPALDGGYYLLGLRAPCPAAFHGIAWSTPAVLAQTRERLRAVARRIVELPPLEDIDDAASWNRALIAGHLPRLPRSGE